MDKTIIQSSVFKTTYTSRHDGAAVPKSKESMKAFFIKYQACWKIIFNTQALREGCNHVFFLWSLLEMNLTQPRCLEKLLPTEQ